MVFDAVVEDYRSEDLKKRGELLRWISH